MPFVRWVAIASGLVLFSLSTARADLPPELENPGCLGVNKEPAHATLMPYASLQEALAARRQASSFARSLNGTWKFHWVAHPDQRPVDFYKPDFDVSGWADIPVPSCWQLLGYGTPYYRNLGYIFQKDWPRVLTAPPKDWTAYTERNPVGSYRRAFEVPAAWNGRRIFLTFDGVDSAFYVWINGHKVGYSVNSRNAAEFDVTKYIQPGQNLLAVEVYRFSVGSYLEDQDMWRLSGIFRNVTLWSSPQVHIRDFFVKTDLDKDYRDATVEVVAKLKNFSDTVRIEQSITTWLYDRTGKLVDGAVASGNVPVFLPGQEQSVTLKFPVPHPAKWTAETPNLYTLVLGIGPGNQQHPQATELLSTRIGFRKVEIDGRVFKINGVPVKLKGANRHENWPDTGHYVSEERMIRDIEVLKQCNCNHVRTCHYSDDPRWYELCDEYGLYLNAEANIESHGYGYGPESLSNPPEWKAAHVDRVVANVENFKNHPSVVMWSLGNEAGSGPNFHAALAAARAIDTSRPYHYERFGTGKDNPADVDSEMYTHPTQVERIAQDPNLTKPFYMCEYAHAMFNSMGSIADYNDIFDKYPSLMGGAIWEWEDQGIWNRRDPKRPFIAYGGGFGEVPNDHYFIHKGVVFSDRSPKPHYPEAKHAYQWVGFVPVDLKAGKVKIKNKYAFTNLSKFNGSWTVSRDGQVIDRGTLGRLDLAPGAETVVTIPFKPITWGDAEHFLRVAFTLPADEPWAKAGFEVASQQFELPPIEGMGAMMGPDTKPLKLTRTDGQITVAGDGFTVVFDRSQGAISKLERAGKNVILPGGGPKLHLWRAPHRNDDMWAYDQWERLGVTALKRDTVRFDAEEAGENTVRVEVVVMEAGKGGFRVLHSSLYTIDRDGSIAVDNAVMPQGRRIPIARLGVRMLLDTRLGHFTYLGRGPMENYVDRKRGSDVGLYSGTVRANMTPYAKPMECGNHEDVRWAAFTGAGVPGLLAQADGRLLQVSALPYTDEVMTPIEYTVDLPKSESTVVTIAGKTLGVGSNGCGPRPLDACIVWLEPATFSYVLRLIPDAETDLSRVGRSLLPRDRVEPVLARRNGAGRVELMTGTKGATIEYAADGKTWAPYAAPFAHEASDVIAVRAKAEGFDRYEGAVAVAAVDQRTRWKVTSASSFEAGEGEPAHVLDGSLDTFWHSRWSPSLAQPPHSLTIDFGQTLDVAAIVYEARRDMDHGHVKAYEIYLSLDGTTWGDPAARGTFRKGALTQTVRLTKPVKARFLKFVALSEQSGESYATVAELSVIEAGK